MDGQDGQDEDGVALLEPEAEAPGPVNVDAFVEVIAGTEVVVLGEHKNLRASAEFWESAFVSRARALPLRAPIGRFGLLSGGLFIPACGRVGRGAG